MNIHNIGFYEDLTKNLFQLSSNMHLISSSVLRKMKHGYMLCTHQSAVRFNQLSSHKQN